MAEAGKTMRDRGATSTGGKPAQALGAVAEAEKTMASWARRLGIEVRRELAAGWQRWVSFACIWLWSCLVGKTALSALVVAQLPGALAVPTALTLFANVAMLVVIVFLSDSLRTVVGSRGTMALAGILLVGGSAGFIVTALTGSVVAFACGSCLGGAAIAFLKIAWGETFSRMSLKDGLLDMGIALVVSTIVFLVLLPAPSPVHMVALVGCSLPCAPLACAGALALRDQPAPPPPPGAARTVAFSWTLLILPVLVGLSAGLIMGLMPMGGEGMVKVSVGMTVAELLAGVFLLAASGSLNARFGASQIYAVGLIFTVAGLTLVSVDAVPAWVAMSVDRLGFAVFYFFMVVYWGDLARRIGKPVVRTYAFGYAVFQAAQIPSLLMGTYLGAGSSSATVALMCSAVVLAIFMVTLLVFNDSHSSLRRWLTAGEPTETTDDIPEACAAIAVEYALSPREREVLSLLARGRTAAHIARSLGIAQDTAKTHIRSVYRKMDVHAQQDLIELISERVELSHAEER